MRLLCLIVAYVMYCLWCEHMIPPVHMLPPEGPIKIVETEEGEQVYV